jgi:hypothetical protein
MRCYPVRLGRVGERGTESMVLRSESDNQSGVEDGKTNFSHNTRRLFKRTRRIRPDALTR